MLSEKGYARLAARLGIRPPIPKWKLDRIVEYFSYECNQADFSQPTDAWLELCSIADRDEKRRLFSRHTKTTRTATNELLTAINGKLLSYHRGLFAVNHAEVQRVILPEVTVDALTRDHKYTFTSKAHDIPYRIQTECLDEYITYCQSLAQKPHEQKKIELVTRLLKRDDSCIIGDYLTALSKTTRQQLEQWSLGRKSSTGKDMFTAPIGEWVEGYRDFLIMLAKQELNIFLQMKPRTEKVDTLETVFRKYHPENYDKVFSGGPYTIEATRNGHLIKQAALATQQSCIRQEALEFFEEDAADPGTRYHIAKRKGKLMGYVRTFFMRNNKGQLVTAIDTMEVPHKDFEKHTTLLSAMALGTILFSFDSGASSVIGKEGRIKYVRESFSNASKHVSLTKTGRLDEVWHYQFQWSTDGNVSADAYLLMTNWKV